MAQRDGRTRPEPKPGVKGFCESGGQGVEVDGRGGGGSVEGQGARRTVHVHPQSVAGGGRGRGRDELSLAVVAHGVAAFVGAAQAPGHVVEAKLAVVAASFTADVSVSHRDLHLPFPPHLPEAAVGQTLCTHHLGPEVESIGVVWIQLLLLHARHLPVVVGQPELPVHRVRVDGEPTGI